MIYSNIHLPADSYDFVRNRVENGSYENANDLMRAALRALHREEVNSQAKQKPSSIAEGDVFRRLWEISVESSQTRH
ncbi:MAG: type II toxin-antitoxin system ParD family antitoxin [Terracidiphilus sp.]|jgi:putative addiction module CopG family antidote